MSWFTRHTSWLVSESYQLSNSPFYKEQYQKLDKTFISTGEIPVYQEQVTLFPVLIIYPEATPYVPPRIYLLEVKIDEETAEKYSRLSSYEVQEAIKENIYFHYRRHQGSDGGVCFVETGDLHGENAEHYAIKDILKRVQRWLAGDPFIDSQEVELFLHFPQRVDDMKYLLPDLFYDEEYASGTFYAGLSTHVPANWLEEGSAQRTYTGVYIIGKNRHGVTLPPKEYVHEQLILFTQIPQIQELLDETEKKRKEIEEGRLIEGYWWDVGKEPEPFKDIRELAAYVGRGDAGQGFSILTRDLGSELDRYEDMIHIGLRFPGRKKRKEWQMFQLKRGSRSPIVGQGESELGERLKDYTIYAVDNEDLTEDYFHLRNNGRADRSVLKWVKVSMIGCGALGSETADALGKAGVGYIHLVDKENLEFHNIVRHSLGFRRINLPKVFGMREQIVTHNPFVATNAAQIDVLSYNIENYVPEDGVGISTLADDNVEAFLNEQAVNAKRTVFYCRVLRGGKAARIFRVIPHKDACKYCLSLYASEGDERFVDIPEDESLPVLTNECNNPVRPASAADMKSIAGVFARIVIEYLQGSASEDNHWIWITEDGFRVDSSAIPPHKDCPLCRPLKERRIKINRSVYESVRAAAFEAGGRETGGVMVGYREENGDYMIRNASGPGGQSVRSNSWFERDLEYCQSFLNTMYERYGERGLYIGEWHFHPKGSNEPSARDIKSLTEIANSDNYKVDRPVLLVLSGELEFGITIHETNGSCTKLPLTVEEE